MSEKPIIFSGEMINAILDGRKTQTRRIIKPQPVEGIGCWAYREEFFVTDEDLRSYLFHNVYGDKGSPYGAIYSDGTRDQLWVRETWASIKTYDNLSPSKIPDCPMRYYRAWNGSAKYSPHRGKWRPSIYMPRWASRLTLELVDIRIERLHNATLADLIAEGCPAEHLPENCNGMSHAVYGWFEHLWDSINLKRGYGYETNPWVWVVEFEAVRE